MTAAPILSLLPEALIHLHLARLQFVLAVSRALILSQPGDQKP